MSIFQTHDLHKALQEAHHDLGNFLVIDVSSDRCVVAEMSYNDFGIFILGKFVPLNKSITPQTVERDLLPEINQYYQGQYSYIYLIGEYANDQMVQEVLKQKASNSLQALGLGRMPNSQALRTYLDKQDVIMPYDLALVMLQIPNINNGIDVLDVNVVYEMLIANGEKLQNNRTIKVMEFQTTRVGKVMYFYVFKGVNGQYHQYGDCYTVIPRKPTFKLTIKFMNGQLNYQWTDADPTGDYLYRNQPIPFLGDTYRVNVTMIPPKVLFLVEATLGIKRMMEKTNQTEIEDVTDFNVVCQFIKNVSLTLKTVLGSHVQYNVWFYHDFHEQYHQLIIPYEFRGAGLVNPNEVIEKLNDDFLPYDSFVNLLGDEYYGISKPSQVFDWQKPLEVVAHQLNQQQLDKRGIVLIWIGQSSPHLYQGNEMSLYAGGIQSQYDFQDEIEQLHRKGIIQFALFVNSDLPQPMAIQRESRRTWQQIASRPIDRYFYEIRLVKPNDATLDAHHQLYNVLNELDVQSTILLTFTDENMLYLPIHQLAPNMQIKYQD